MEIMRLLKVKDIQEIYGVSRKTATRWAMASGPVPRTKGQTIWVREDNLNEYLKGEKEFWG